MKLSWNVAEFLTSRYQFDISLLDDVMTFSHDGLSSVYSTAFDIPTVDLSVGVDPSGTVVGTATSLGTYGGDTTITIGYSFVTATRILSFTWTSIGSRDPLPDIEFNMDLNVLDEKSLASSPNFPTSSGDITSDIVFTKTETTTAVAFPASGVSSFTSFINTYSGTFGNTSLPYVDFIYGIEYSVRLTSTSNVTTIPGGDIFVFYDPTGTQVLPLNVTSLEGYLAGDPIYTDGTTTIDTANFPLISTISSYHFNNLKNLSKHIYG